MRLVARVAALAGALASCVLVAVPSAQAAPLPPADLGTPTVVLSHKPIWGSLQNLPGVGVTAFSPVGPGMAPAIEHYYESGQAASDQTTIARKGRTLVQLRLDELCGGNPKACKAMVVFDVDETLLNNYGYYVVQSPPFTIDQATWLPYSEKCGQTANAPVVKLYRQVRAMGVKIAIVTGRAEADRPWTRDCLHKRGIDGWETLILKPTQAPALASRWKADVRGRLQQEGFTILASVGDQLSDMSHGRLAAGVWLPNPMYFIP